MVVQEHVAGEHAGKLATVTPPLGESAKAVVLWAALFYVVYRAASWAGAERVAVSSRAGLNKLTAAERKSLRYQVASRAAALAHVAAALPLAAGVLLGDPSLRADRLFATSPASYAALQVSAGYFLYDLLQCVTHVKEEGVPFVIHALACFLLFAYGAARPFCHAYGAAFVFTWEFTTPFVHARWLMHTRGETKSRAYLFNAMAMMLAFFLARNVTGLFLSVDFWRTANAAMSTGDPRAPPNFALIAGVFKVANIALNGLNAMWMSKMVRGAIKLATNAKSKKTS
eukprot:jgi/Chlat1/6840/Chrsp51S06523